MIFESIINDAQDFLENCKEKEYVVYRNTIGGYQKVLLTKAQLTDYINKNQLADLDIYKINNKIKIKRTLEILEDK